jgi:teichuronic acid biosynthesis glycosyltransferase TuaG
VILNRKFFNNDKYQFAKLKTKEDYVLWIKLAKNEVKMLSIEENLSSWRKSKNSLSSSTLQKLLDGYKVYRVHLNYGRLKSLLYLLILSINFIIKN